MKRAMLAVLLLLAGCADPINGRLPAGSEVVVINEKSTTATLYEAPGPAAKSESIQVGTKCRVISDEEEDGPLSRFVRVKTLDGTANDKVGYLLRSELRPVAR